MSIKGSFNRKHDDITMLSNKKCLDRDYVTIVIPAGYPCLGGTCWRGGLPLCGADCTPPSSQTTDRQTDTGQCQTDKQIQVNGDVSKAIKIKKSQERRNKTKMDQNLSLLL